MSAVAGKCTNSGYAWIEVAGKRYEISSRIWSRSELIGHKVTLTLDSNDRVTAIHDRGR